jgi:hypothetical protein
MEKNMGDILIEFMQDMVEIKMDICMIQTILDGLQHNVVEDANLYQRVGLLVFVYSLFFLSTR